MTEEERQRARYGHVLYDEEDAAYAATPLWSPIPPVGFVPPVREPPPKRPAPAPAPVRAAPAPARPSTAPTPAEPPSKSRKKSSFQRMLDKKKKELAGSDGTGNGA